MIEKKFKDRIIIRRSGRNKKIIKASTSNMSIKPLSTLSYISFLTCLIRRLCTAVTFLSVFGGHRMVRGE